MMRGGLASRVLQLVKDLDLKAFHNPFRSDQTLLKVLQLVKDLDLKAFHNAIDVRKAGATGITARQRS